MKQYTKEEPWQQLPQKTIKYNTIGATVVIIFFLLWIAFNSLLLILPDTNIGESMMFIIINIVLVLVCFRIFLNYFLLFKDISCLDIDKFTFSIEIPDKIVVRDINAFNVYNEKNKRITMLYINESDTWLILKNRPKSITYYGLKRSRQLIELISINASNQEKI